jgi:hypothetical protein
VGGARTTPKEQSAGISALESAESTTNQRRTGAAIRACVHGIQVAARVDRGTGFGAPTGGATPSTGISTTSLGNAMYTGRRW